MIAIILAAGFSTRLYPLTKEIPKGLLPMGNRKIASSVVDDLLCQSGINKTYLITSSCFAKQYRTWLDSNYNGKINLLENGVMCIDKKLGAIGDLLHIINTEHIDDDILVTPSDTLTSLRLHDFLAFFRTRGGVTTAVYETDDRAKIAGRLGCAVLEGDRISRFVEKPLNPPSLYMAVPYYIFPRKTIPLIRQYQVEGNALDSPGSIISWLTAKIPVYAYRVNGYYHDVGTPEIYRTLQLQFNQI